jgi:hypothetical protein
VAICARNSSFDGILGIGGFCGGSTYSGGGAPVLRGKKSAYKVVYMSHGAKGKS